MARFAGMPRLRPTPCDCHQVFVNLLGIGHNTGWRPLDITVGFRSTGDSRWRRSIGSDCGVGINIEDQNRIFDKLPYRRPRAAFHEQTRFMRLDRTGLDNRKGIVDAHAGDLCGKPKV